jgi:hypothetical protein
MRGVETGVGSAETGVGSEMDIGMSGVIKINSAGSIGLETGFGTLADSAPTHVRANKKTYLEKRLKFIEIICLLQRVALHAKSAFIPQPTCHKGKSVVRNIIDLL